MAAEPVTHPTSPAPWWTSALDLVFPPRCVGCGRRGADVCDACIAALRPLGSQVCPLCGGRGWIVGADGGAGTARLCSCREDGVSQRLFEAAGIPPRYRHCRISRFETSNPSRAIATVLERARKVAQQYLDDFIRAEDGGLRRSGLLFMGPPGSGKTHLAVGVLGEAIERYRVRGRFAEFTSLILQIQSTFDPGSTESKHEILDPLMSAELLVLDELGSQQPTPWVRDVLYLIVNHRYTHQLPTLFTTNYQLPLPDEKRTRPVPVQESKLDRGRDPEPVPDESAKLLAWRLPAMLVSRLYEMGQIVDMTSVGDFRREVGAHGRTRR